MRVQAKSLQAEASRWSKDAPYDNPYVSLRTSQHGDKTWTNINPETVLIAPQYTVIGSLPKVVNNGDWIVKFHDSYVVGVYSDAEFKLLFNIVEPLKLVGSGSTKIN